MGEIKRRNRALPQHLNLRPEEYLRIEFFEQLIKHEVDKVMHDTYTPERIHYYPPMTTDISERIHLVG